MVLKEDSVALWKGGAFAADEFVTVGESGDLPDGPVLVPLKRFLAERDTLLARNEPVGVIVQPAEKLDDIAADLPRLPLLALAFPKFGDGRAFSLARLARERHGFSGELRAVGDILFDRIAYMTRCGFDALDITNEPTLRALRDGRVPVSHELYQPTGKDSGTPDPTKPWRRRA
jgi:uncharacterized protein (DUF934 family)